MTEQQITDWIIENVPLGLSNEFKYRISLIKTEILERNLIHNLTKLKEDAQWSHYFEIQQNIQSKHRREFD